MKTSVLIKQAFILVVMMCLAVYLVDAHGGLKRTKNRHYNTAKSSRLALATMKIKSVRFGFNSINVPSQYYSSLNRVAKLMKDNNASLKVNGYADKTGGYVYNWKLSEKRAQAVKAYLVNKGADSTRIAATAFGFTHPVASNKTPAGRAKNRRAEVHFAL